MISRPFISSVLACVLCALTSQNLLAQTATLSVTTNTGDKLSGKFINITSECLTLETSYAGVITLRVADLSAWQTADESWHKQIAAFLPAAAPAPQAATPPVVAVAKPANKPAPQILGKPSKTETWQRSVNFAYALSRGNANSSDLNASLALSRKRGTKRIAFNALGRYSVRNGTQVAHLLTSTARYERTILHVPVFSETLFEVDRIKKLEYRVSENLGFTYPLLKRDSQQLTLDFGTGLTREVYEKGATRPHTMTATGLSFHPELLKATSLFRAKAEQKINGKAQLSQQVSIFSDLMEPDSYRMQTDISLTMPITRYLGFKLAGLNRFDNQPITANVKRNDFSLLTGFNINF